MVLDWLASGLDPKKCVIFRQSWVKPHAELHLLLSMMTPLSWLERVPTYKEQMQEMKNKDLSTYGFLGYPVLQSADILLYKQTRTRWGRSAAASRADARNWPALQSSLRECFSGSPSRCCLKSPKIPGTDGRKMSKSYNNAVLLSDTKEEVAAKVKTMYTDPKKIRVDDKGHPEGCVVFATHKLYTPEVAEIETRCKAGTIGLFRLQNPFDGTLNAGLEPIRSQRAVWAKRTDDVKDILRKGSEQAAHVAAATMKDVYRAVKIDAMSAGGKLMSDTTPSPVRPPRRRGPGLMCVWIILRASGPSPVSHPKK